MQLFRVLGVIAAAGLLSVSSVSLETSSPQQENRIAVQSAASEDISTNTHKDKILESYQEKLQKTVSKILTNIEEVKGDSELTNDTLKGIESEISNLEITDELSTLLPSMIFVKEAYTQQLDEELEDIISLSKELESSWVVEYGLELDREAVRLEEIRLEEERAALEASSSSPYFGGSSDQTRPQNSNGVDFHLGVAGWGAQGLVDSCTGAVWWEEGYNLIAEHWYCGGSSFPQWDGAIIYIEGSGTYRSSGIVGIVDQATSNASYIPGGYDVVYQTCLNNNSGTTGFFGLIRVG